MRCPYCVSDINPKALACPICRRDLYVVKPLLEQIDALETQLAAAKQAQLATVTEYQEETPLPSLPPLASRWGKAVISCLIPLLLLVTSHVLLDFIYDAKTIYLRLIALIVPLPFGFLFSRFSHLRFLPSTIVGFLMAASAVLAMSGVTGLVDQTPVMPQSMLDLREFIEFSTSIALSFVTGAWLALWGQKRAERRASALERARRLGALAATSGQHVKDSLNRLNDVGSAAVACATTAFSIYTGLKGFFGH